MTALVCQTRCGGVRGVRRASAVELRGRHLAAVTYVLFAGGPGRGDDRLARAREATATSVRARVPRGVQDGPVLAINVDGARSAPAHGVAVIVRAPRPQTDLAFGVTEAEAGIDVEVLDEKVYFGAPRDATLTYVLRTPEPADVTVELVRADDGVSIKRWATGVVAPDTPRSVTWNGVAGGAVQRDGRYEFRVRAETAGGVRASSAQSGDAPGDFMFLRHKFPIRGKHDYGEFAAGFGGGRGHQGQDVFAECGTKLVAARAGVVKFKQYHSRAGHYIVIDGDHTPVDYVYMHLQDAALVDKGDHVYTGQPIGYVGDTGRAFGCHLHFELWSGPGWYSGGAPFDPKPELLAWDQYS